LKPFAHADDGGTVRTLSPNEAASLGHGCRLLWIHLDLNDPATKAFLIDRLGLQELVASALTATETRPRCEPMEDGALVNLRGLSLEDEPDADPLVSIRLWIARGRIVSISRYTLRALPAMEAAMKTGHVKDPGDFVAILADHITQDLDPHVADYGDQLDECELMLDATQAFALRRQIAVVRGKAIEYRRFVAPQRQALERLSGLECEWLEPDDRQHLIEAADRFARMAEELESIRERAALMHEQITDLRAEQTEQRGLLVSVLALVFLPLTFLTGLYGMNVPLPYHDEGWAFYAILGLSGLVVVGGVGYFLRARWFR
jgi:zinc transporter